MQRITINIPVSVIPHVIGKGGRNIREIQAQSGASVSVDTARTVNNNATVTIRYGTPEQRIIANNMIRRIRTNQTRNVFTYPHPEINVTLAVAGSLLPDNGDGVDAAAVVVVVDNESSDAVSFIPHDNNNNNSNNTRDRCYKAGVKIKAKQQDPDSDPLTEDLQRMTLSARQPFEDQSVLIVDQSVAERDSIEERFAAKVSEHAQSELLSKKDKMRWRVEVGLGQLLFYNLKSPASTSVKNFQNFTIGRNGDLKIRFDNRIPEDKAEPLVQFLEEQNFELKRHEEEIAVHLLKNNNRISVNVLVDRCTDTLQPRYITRDQRKPIFLDYQHASLISNESAELALPNVPSIDMRIRLQTNEHSEEIPATIDAFVSSLAENAIRNAENNLIVEMKDDINISLDSMRIKRTDEFSDGTHTVAIEKIHDENGQDVHTEVTINSDPLDIYTEDKDEIQKNIRKLLNFSRSIMENVFSQ